MNKKTTPITSTMTRINGAALMEAFKKRNLPYSEIAEQFGYSKNYFTSCARTGSMRTSLCELLWNEYNLPLDEYKAGVDTDAPAGTVAQYDTIHKAVYDAISECQEMLYAAVYGAMKKCLKEYSEGR